MVDGISEVEGHVVFGVPGFGREQEVGGGFAVEVAAEVDAIVCREAFFAEYDELEPGDFSFGEFAAEFESDHAVTDDDDFHGKEFDDKRINSHYKLFYVDFLLINL